MLYGKLYGDMIEAACTLAEHGPPLTEDERGHSDLRPVALSYYVNCTLCTRPDQSKANPSSYYSTLEIQYTVKKFTTVNYLESCYPDSDSGSVAACVSTCGALVHTVPS